MCSVHIERCGFSLANFHVTISMKGGESGRDTCHGGDSGSPLNCEVPNTGHRRFYVTGQVSWEIGCADSAPGVYVNVAKFRHWFDNVFDQRNIQKCYIAS